MPKCSVKKCPNAGINVDDDRRKSFSLHKFPRDKLLKKQWLDFLEMDEKKLTSSTRICSEHFAPDRVFTKIKKHKPTRELRPGTIPIDLRSTEENETPVVDLPVDDSPVVCMQNRSLSNQTCKRLREDKEPFNFLSQYKSFLNPASKRFRKDQDVDTSIIRSEEDPSTKQNLDLTHKVTKLEQEIQKKSGIIDKLNRRIAKLLMEKKNISRNCQRCSAQLL
ncbi:hypothetical protein DMENIID0001_168210 [Sergentomyia squamirostris]